MILFPGLFIEAEVTMGIRNWVATRRSVSRLLLAFSLLLAALIVVKVTVFVGAIAETRALARHAIFQGHPALQQTPEKTADLRRVVEGLKKNNLFVRPGPHEHPVKEVTGILGDEVLIDNKWYKCHDKIGAATVVRIGPTEVCIEWEGSERTFTPIKSCSPASDAGSRPVTTSEKKQSPRYAQMVITGQVAVPPWWSKIPFQDLPTQEQEKLQRLKERWFDMSEQEQQDAMNALRKRFGE